MCCLWDLLVCIYTKQRWSISCMDMTDQNKWLVYQSIFKMIPKGFFYLLLLTAERRSGFQFFFFYFYRYRVQRTTWNTVPLLTWNSESPYMSDLYVCILTSSIIWEYSFLRYVGLQQVFFNKCIKSATELKVYEFRKSGSRPFTFFSSKFQFLNFPFYRYYCFIQM